LQECWICAVCPVRPELPNTWKCNDIKLWWHPCLRARHEQEGETYTWSGCQEVIQLLPTKKQGC
jgi:hypothetical protein